jgi:mRNA-degrading endonuclease YafQ of YafQ-DinJ toxin-antitoxin module
VYSLVFTESYEARASKFLKKHPELAGQYAKTLKLLELDPHYPALRLHKVNLRGNEIYSVSINLSYRIVLDLMIEESRIIPVNIGSHDEVYR